jgi:phospholipid transport system transporter-binding protein
MADDVPVLEGGNGAFRVRGPVTLASVQALLDQSRDAFTAADLRIDFSAVSEADSAAVALMLAWARDAAARGATIRFEQLSANLRTLVSLYDVGELLPGV